MPVRSADVTWKGGLKSGKGTMRMASGAYEGDYSFDSRFEEDPGTNPEELIAAAHAGCFSMALALNLGQAGYEPKRVSTTARVHIQIDDEGIRIPRIELDTEAVVPGIDEATFREEAEKAKDGCPVSQALRGVDEVMLSTRLVAVSLS